MKRFGSEKSWANNVFSLRKAYNLPLNDTNVQNMSQIEGLEAPCKQYSCKECTPEVEK